MDELYDEFGNYIGPEEDSSSSDEDMHREDAYHEDTNVERHESPGSADMQDDRIGSSTIVLHEDRKYYPDADEVFHGAEVMIEDEDAQGIEEPIIKPIVVKSFEAMEEGLPKLKFNLDFLSTCMSDPRNIRNVALIGHIHHGKTSFCDILIEQIMDLKVARYCDTRHDEQARQISIKSTPITLPLPDSRGKTHVLNVMDCPGHVGFSDEATAALRLADGAVLVVDAVEGAMMNTQRMIKLALDMKKPICLCITKVDRLIHELRLPPADAYFKLANIIDTINSLIATYSGSHKVLSPVSGNVCFSSGTCGWCFTLKSFAKIYVSKNKGINSDSLAKKLWGDQFYCASSRKFVSKPDNPKSPRSFVAFVLEPLYKLHSQILGEEPQQLRKVVQMLGIKLSKVESLMDPKPLLRIVMSRFFKNDVSSFTTMIVDHFSSPKNEDLLKNSLHHSFSGTPETFNSMLQCDPQAPLMVNIVKQYPSTDGKDFLSLGRIYSGYLEPGQKVQVVGEKFTTSDQEDVAPGTVKSIYLCLPRYRVSINKALPGNWVLIEGISNLVVKTATLTTIGDAQVFLPLVYNTKPVMKIAVEPINPSELPKMIHGIRCINKTYPLLQTKVEESGEHSIFGPDELYLDSAMYDLRNVFSEIEIKVSDPGVAFSETVVETSSVKAWAETPNGLNKLAMIAEPLENGLGEAIECGRVKIDGNKKELDKVLMDEFEWDKLGIRSLWAFGPGSTHGPNVLVDETSPGEVDKSLLSSVKSSIVQGFRWGCREGPLCDEPFRNVKFRILDATIAADSLQRGAGYLIPAARRVTYSSFLTATPRLMEPIYRFEIQTVQNTNKQILNILRRRRAHITSEEPIPGTPFFKMVGLIPVIDSIGFETDIRAQTNGLAFVLQVFDHWDVVPGNPLDSSVILLPLEASRGQDLAREFMIKTRRRKGLPEDVSLEKYFDDQSIISLRH